MFAAGWFARAGYDASRGSLAGWLVGIARNKIIDHLRAQRRRPNGEPLPADHELPSADSVDALADRLLLAEAMTHLSPRSRQLLEMSFFDELSHPEIAERCDVPLGTVKSDIRRGLAKLRRHLERAT